MLQEIRWGPWSLGLPEASAKHTRAYQLKDHAVLALFAGIFFQPPWVIFRDKVKCVTLQEFLKTKFNTYKFLYFEISQQSFCFTN